MSVIFPRLLEKNDREGAELLYILVQSLGEPSHRYYTNISDKIIMEKARQKFGTESTVNEENVKEKTIERFGNLNVTELMLKVSYSININRFSLETYDGLCKRNAFLVHFK